LLDVFFVNNCLRIGSLHDGCRRFFCCVGGGVTFTQPSI
jgi:hypothetical protein